MHTSHLVPVSDTSIEMKTVLILLVLGYASSDKLDLSYLPPPGSQYAGGRPGDIQIPLEFPKETSLATLNPQIQDNRGLSPEDYKATIGIDRIPGVQDIGTVTPGLPSSSSTFQNTQRVPTTTVSYAYTQTTTHPPTEGFETTIGPQVTGGFPSTDSFNNVPSQEGLINEGNLFDQNRPGHQQAVNQFGPRPTPAQTSRPVFNIPSLRPGMNYEENLNAQGRPGYKEVINQFGQPILVPTSGSPVPSLVPGQQVYQQKRPGQQQIYNQFQPGYQQSVIENIPGGSPTQQPFRQNQYRNRTTSGNVGVTGRPGYVTSTVAPQGFPSASQPINTIPFGDNFGNLPGSVTNIPQSTYPELTSIVGQHNQIPIGQQQIGDRQTVSQQIPGSQTPNQFGGVGSTPIVPSSTFAPNGTPGVSYQQFPGTSIGPQKYPGLQGVPGFPAEQNVFLPSSTAAPTFSTPGVISQGFPTGTSLSPGLRDQQYPSFVAPGSYPTPIYPGAEANAAASVYRNQPGRPQAEADRNAVILNYENEISPEGYAYSFDTSNGIHADESGTATDGVKAHGSYSYTGDDGKVYSVVYTADEDGFRPRGDHLPTPPPIPEAIQRVIELAEKEKEAGISDDGSYDEYKYGHEKYQGNMRRRPQFSNKAIPKSEDESTETTVHQKKQRIRPQAEKMKPIVSDLETEYDEITSESALDNDGLSENDDRRKFSQSSPQRPINHVTDVDNEDDEEGNIEEDVDVYNEQNLPPGKRPTNLPFAGATSRHPDNQSIKKQYNKITSPAPEETVIGKRRRPVGKKPISEGNEEDQDSDEYTERPKYKNYRNKNRYVNKATARPQIGYEEEDQYENEDFAPNNYGEEKSSNRPSTTRGPLRRPASNEDNAERQTFDKYGRPVPEKEVNKFKQTKPLKKPYLPDESETITEDYDFDEDNVTKQPSKPGPVGGSITNKYTSRDDIGAKRRPTRPGHEVDTSRDDIAIKRRPSRPGFEVDRTIDKNIEYQPDNIDEYINSEINGDEQTQGIDNNRPFNAPSKGNRHQDNEEVFENVESTERDYSSTPKVSPTKTYVGTRGKPHINVNDDGNQESENKRVNAGRPVTKFGQKIVRPGFEQQTDFIEDQVYNNRPFNGSGYQYIPPQKKFDQDEVNVLPNRFKGTTRRPFIGKQTPIVHYEDKTRPRKPFMTTNVSPISKPDEHDHGIISGKPETTPEQQANRYDFPEDGTTTDQAFGDDEISSTGPVHQYSSTTRRPIQQHSTGRPQYTQKVPGVTNGRVTQKGKPFGVISSTSPMPSTNVYGSTNAPARPGQPIKTYYNVDGSHKHIPGQVSISSTTPFATPSSTIDDGSYLEENRFQTTYGPGQETIRPTTDYEDGTTSHRFPTSRPTDAEISIVPGVSKDRHQENFPSTTYRPNIVTAGQNQPSSTARPGVLVDRYGRPINIPGSHTTVHDFIPGGNQVFSTVRPEGVDVYGRPIRPGSEATLQGLPGVQNVPSSTSTPEVVVDAFGRPIVRPQPGTTIQGIVPGNQNNLSSTVRPGLSVDAYGRPIKTPGSTITSEEYVQGSQPSTVRPGGLVDAFGRPINYPETNVQGYLPGQSRPSSTVRPGVTIDAFGRPVSSPGSTPQQFPSSYPAAPGVEHLRPGVPGIHEQGQYHPGTSSAGQFRGQQKYQPGFTRPGLSTSSTFQPSTERVIGEDFSGPKQQQKFDPQRGYYYK